MKSVFNFVCVYVCTIVGASFITGNEIYTFFARYGTCGYLLAVLCFLLFVSVSLTLFLKFKKVGANSLMQVFEGSLNKKRAIAYGFLRAFTYATYYVFCVVMLAGLRELFGIVFTCFSTLICFLLIKRGIKSIIKINLLLFPLVLIYLGMLFALVKSGQAFNFKSVDAESVFNIFTYVSLNVVLLFGSMLKITSSMTKRQIVVATVASGIIFTALIVSQIIILTKCQVTNFAMPLMQIASSNKFVYVFALGVAFLAMVSSYLSGSYSLYTKIKQSKNENFYLLILVLSMLALSFLGFNAMLKFSYIFLGISSLLIVLYLSFSKLK